MNYLSKISFAMMICFPLIIYAADEPTLVEDNKVFNMDMCIQNNKNECINANCLTSTDTECIPNCAEQAVDKCKEQASE